MELQRKDRIIKIVMGIIFLFLAAFSLPFQNTLHAEAYTDQNTYNISDNWYDLQNVAVNFWNWAHNDLRYPIIAQLNSIESTLSASGIADTSSKLDSIESTVSSIDVAGDIQSFYDSKTAEGSTEIELEPIKFTKNKIDLANRMWGWVGKVLSAGGNLSKANFSNYSVSLGVDIDDIENDYSALIDAMKIVAYSIVLLFFSVSLIESTIKYEIVTIKGGVMLFGRLLISKIIIDLSSTFCTRIIGVVEWASKLAIESMNITTQTQALSTDIAATSESKLWVIGKIIDFFGSLAIIPEYLMIALVIIIVSMCVLGKLSLRSVQLALMTAVSPIFFACASTEVTKHYFRNFITGFLQCTMQILFMVIVYAMGSAMLGSDAVGGNVLNAFNSTYLNTSRAIIIYVVMGILIVKPPKFLTNMLN